VRLYSKEHVWVLATETKARVGISEFAQKELGDIAYIELPAAGSRVARGEAVCAVDSLKSSSEIFTPLSGIVAATNPVLLKDEGLKLVNEDPLGEGWILELEMSDPSELSLLLSEKEYGSYIEGN